MVLFELDDREFLQYYWSEDRLAGLLAEYLIPHYDQWMGGYHMKSRSNRHRREKISPTDKSSSNIFLILGAIIAFVGAVIAAYIGYLGAISQSRIPIQATQTAEARLALLALTPPTIPPTTPAPLKAIIQNKLELPIDVYVDDIYEGLLLQRASDEFILNKIPATIKYSVVRIPKGTDNFWGVPMSGILGRVMNGDTVVINNQIGLELYFYPIISNQSGRMCEIILDDNSPQRETLGYVGSGGINVTVGYLRLHPRSNITFECEGRRSYYGTRYESDHDLLSAIVEPDSGKVVLTISP